MAEPKNQSKMNQNPKSEKTQKENPKTYGKEPPMVDPQTPERPDEYEVNADENQPPEKPTLH